MNHAVQPNRSWLVTGGSGFIGTNLIDSLVKSGKTVRNIDIARPQIDTHLPLWNELDINDKASLKRVMLETSPDVIVHLAAIANFDDALSKLMHVNVEGTKNVLDCALEIN